MAPLLICAFDEMVSAKKVISGSKNFCYIIAFGFWYSKYEKQKGSIHHRTLPLAKIYVKYKQMIKTSYAVIS
jgi:hypothetical protein